MDEQELRRLVAPAVQPFYPTPWRVAEQRGDRHVVVCAEGHYTCEAPTIEAAEIIVAAVNAWATSGPSHQPHPVRPSATASGPARGIEGDR